MKKLLMIGLGAWAALAAMLIWFSVSPESYAQAKRRLTTDLAAIYDHATASEGIIIDTDVATNDGPEATLKANGAFAVAGTLRIGSTTSIQTCLSRDSNLSPPKLFLDWNCDGLKNALLATDCYIDSECGGGGPGSLPSPFPVLMANDTAGAVTGEIAPSAIDQVPVSLSGTTAQWKKLPAAALDTNNSAGNKQFLAFDTPTGKMKWSDATSVPVMRTFDQFRDQPCESFTQGCPDPTNSWVISPWHWGLARAPAGRPDRGVNTNGNSAWDVPAVVDSGNDFISQDVSTPANYTFTLTASEPAGQTTNITLPDGAGVAFCRLTGSPYTPCTTGGTCASVPSANYPETIIIRTDPASRFYMATVASVAGCNATGVKTLTLNDSWPIATDTTDQVQVYKPDGIRPGTFGSGWEVQQILEAKKELYYQPRTNMVPDGKMDNDCASSWVASSGSLAFGTYNPLAKDISAGNNYGSVLGRSCVWSGQAGAGATLDSTPFVITAGEDYFVRWHQRTPLASTTAVGLRIMYDSDANGITDTDFCAPYDATFGRCHYELIAQHADTTDAAEVVPSDPDAAGAAPKGLYANDASSYQGWCSDWCWNVLSFKWPQELGNVAVSIQFVTEAATTIGLDEVVMARRLTGFMDTKTYMHMMFPPGSYSWIHTGDDRCEATPGSGAGNDWVSAVLAYMQFGLRSGRLGISVATGCSAQGQAQNFLSYGIGCSSADCGVASYEDPIGSAAPSPPPKGAYNVITTSTGLWESIATLSNSSTAANVADSLFESSATFTLAATYPASGGGATLSLSSSTTSLPPHGRLKVGNEIFTYSSRSGSTVTILARAQGGTTAYAHATGEAVRPITLNQKIRETGALSIIVHAGPYRGKTDGSENLCTADAAAQDCSEHIQLQNQLLEQRAN